MSHSAPSANALQLTIRRLTAGEPLEPSTLTDAFAMIMAGDATPSQIAAVLVGLRVKGETPQEVAAVVRALRNVMVRLPADRPDELVDTCGTGGGSIVTFNISTAAALLAAGAGVRVAKHGNRSATSQCGSADVLEALGVPLNVPVPVMQQALETAGIVFMFAPAMHPAFKHVGPVRRELAVGTVMNIVGPLANPALVGRQVVGVADALRVPLIAESLKELGARHVMVVHGTGMDEISPFADTHVVEIKDGKTREWTIDARRYASRGADPSQLAGGPPVHNAGVIVRVLSGDNGLPAAADAVVLNAAAALYVAGKAATFDDGVGMAREALTRGEGLAALERLRNAFTGAPSA